MPLNLDLQIKRWIDTIIHSNHQLQLLFLRALLHHLGAFSTCRSLRCKNQIRGDAHCDVKEPLGVYCTFLVNKKLYLSVFRLCALHVGVCVFVHVKCGLQILSFYVSGATVCTQPQPTQQTLYTPPNLSLALSSSTLGLFFYTSSSAIAHVFTTVFIWTAHHPALFFSPSLWMI